ncbi:PASTA domain-containing protein [Mucilaginibacter sp. dw_454]|uniref:PASTA domain-containing protein n=1 Tax=Mucilaginibacter sp. dw_454 TaxID=2720079 RepID=UPI001BD5298B|nr:PASTA domain-containing protein [Mucilaginibacter sp. dw_454]
MSKFGSYLKTTSFRNTLLMAIGAVIAVVLIAFFSLSFYTNHGSGIPVPKLKGMPIDKAIDILKDQGFDYQVDSVYVGDAPPGTVVEQDPDPGTNVKENRKIYLTMVTLKAPPVALPDIDQMPYIQAVATLSNAGLKVGDTSYRADIALNVVLETKMGGQAIKTGQRIPKGSRIDLVLGDGVGASEVDVPDLTNQDLDAVRFVLKNANLGIGTITYQGVITDSSNVVVVSQFPMKTDSVSKVSIGTKINLTVEQAKK